MALNSSLNDLQQQETDAVIELWEIQIGDTTYAYFYSGVDEGLANVQFRNRVTPTTINSYDDLPLQGEGFATKSDGALVRPTLSVANILATFSDALGGLTNQDLLGKKVYRRRTLKKYLYSEGDTSNPPIEFPIQMYYIDRIASETRVAITFELAAAHDLTGVLIPKRIILGNGCSWKYQGASEELSLANQIGGCNWNTFGRVDVNDTIYTIYYNKKNEQVVPDTAVVGAYAGGSITLDNIYSTTASNGNIRKISNDGSLTSPGTLTNYWQATTTSSTPGTPSDTNSNWKRVRVYDPTYTGGGTYNTYTNSDYNQYVTYTLGGESYPRLWQVKNVSQEGSPHDSTPQQNGYWKLGDECAKSVDACARRFNVIIATSNGQNIGSSQKSNQNNLRFGGFPGSRVFS